MMFVGLQHTKEQKELNTREREGQNTTKITSASAGCCENNVCFHRFMHPISLVSDAASDGSTDVNRERHSQSKHHPGLHRGDR